MDGRWTAACSPYESFPAGCPPCRMHLHGPALRDDGADSPNNRSAPNHQSAAAVPQSSVEAGRTVGEEGLPIGRFEADRVHPGIAYEQRNHLVRRS